MLTRLEEFETILLVVQQERCNAVGLTGSLTQALDNFGELKELCDRIDALEKLIEHVKTNVDTIERRIEATEEHFGLTDNTSKIKNLLIPLFVSHYIYIRMFFSNHFICYDFCRKRVLYLKSRQLITK